MWTLAREGPRPCGGGRLQLEQMRRQFSKWPVGIERGPSLSLIFCLAFRMVRVDLSAILCFLLIELAGADSHSKKDYPKEGGGAGKDKEKKDDGGLYAALGAAKKGGG